MSAVEWKADSQVILTSVPWDSDYRNVVMWSPQALMDYCLRERRHDMHALKRTVVIKPGEPIILSVPYALAQNYNYILVRNGGENVDGDRPALYAYFIDNIEYHTPSSTQFTVSLDAWQTYIHKAIFGRCFIERGHVGLADKNMFFGQGSYRLTVPEGFDLGDEYVNISETKLRLASVWEAFYVIASSTNIMEDAGTVQKPNLGIPADSRVGTLPVGTGHYIVDKDNLVKVFDKIKATPWIAQGIQSITALPFSGGMLPSFGFRPRHAGGITYYVDTSEGNIQQEMTLLKDFRWETVKRHTRYAHLKKFMTFPYSAIEITTYTGNPIILKPEKVAENDLRVRYGLSYTQPNARGIITPIKYNSAYNAGKDGYDSYNTQTGFYNLPQIPVASNSYLNYMASNAHSIKFAFDSADWSQQKAIQSANLAYNNNSASMQNMLANNALGVSQMYGMAGIANRQGQAHIDNSMIGTIGGIAGSTISGGLSGGIGGAATAFGMSALSGATSQMQSRANFAADVEARNAATSLSAGTSAAMARNNFNVGMANNARNYDYAQWAAKGDYSNAIAGINAKVRDARMLPPSVNGQMGGDMWQFVNEGFAIYTKLKMISPQAVEMIGEYWLRYGYAISRWIGRFPENFQTMTHFTFWKCQDVTIVDGRMPTTYKNVLRAIFEKGVTVWKSPSDIGNIDPFDNKPVEGVYL